MNIPMPKTSQSHPIRVDWLPLSLPGRIGLTFAPGKHAQSKYDAGRWERDLDLDLARLRGHDEVQIIVCLLEDHELKSLKIANYLARTEAHGFQVRRLPIPDGGVLPRAEPMRFLVDGILESAKLGQHVLIHCAGGLGRAGTVAGCCLIALGKKPDEALTILQETRGPKCPETTEQKNFIRAFKLA